jgi:alanine racemase
MIFHRKRFWAEIDMDAARENFRLLRAGLAPNVKLCCVVKANAYGHGAPYLARAYAEMGADFFAVSNIEEAMQLRRHGVEQKILILGYTPAECAPLLAEYGISQTVFSLEYAEELARFAALAGVSLPIHIKLDSGMGRLGFSCRHGESEAIDEIVRVAAMPHLCPEGIFTHFALADGGEDGEGYTKEQYACFCAAVDALSARGVHFPICHCANSAAMLDFAEGHLDMVRAGIVLYGVAPSREMRHMPPLRPVMSLRAVISQVKTLRAGDTVSYGCVFRAPRDMRIAIVPVGYADGYLRRNGEAGAYMLLHGKRAPIVGRICMDQLMLDVSDIPNVAPSDEVTVLGSDGEEIITAEALAEMTGTIPYEILCGVGERVPRFYLSGGQVLHIKDNIIEGE